MSDWKRTTREITFDHLAADIKTAIQKHLELYNIGDILADTLLGIQTDSEKAKKGLFSSAEITHIVAFLTPRWLVWVVSGTKTPAAALSAQLRDVVIEDYTMTQFAKLIPDSGIQVSGRFTDVSENGSAFIGLEDNDVGMKFKELIISTVQQSKK